MAFAAAASRGRMRVLHGAQASPTLAADLLIVLCSGVFFLGLCWVVRRLRPIPELRRHLWVAAAFMALILSSGATNLIGLAAAWWPMDAWAIVLKTFCAGVMLTASAFIVFQAPSVARRVQGFFDLQAIIKAQAAQLTKSENFLDRTGRVAGIGGWEVDLLTNDIVWSDETCRIHGALPGFRPTLEKALSVYPGAARTTIAEAVEAAAARGVSYDLEVPVVRFDGRKIWARAVGMAEFDDGRAIRLTGAFQDVTAKVEAREALRLATDRMKLATDSGGIGIWDWDIKGNQLICDQWMYRLHGRNPEKELLPGELWRDHLHPEDRAHVEQALQDAVTGVREYDTEFRLIWEDGSIHNIRGAARVTRDRDGQALHMVGANWEVTESRRLIAQLAEERELLRVTLKSIGDAVITTNTAGRIDWLNPVAERMTGWSLGEGMGMPLDVVFQTLNDEERAPEEAEAGRWMTQEEMECPAQKALLIARHGEQYGIESSVAPICDARGGLLGKVYVFRDVTEARRLRAAADVATKSQLRLKDEFLSHVSHELRSPLTSIYSFCSIVADDLAGETTPQQQEYLQIVLKNVAQLQSMIEDLLTVTQSREGKMRVEFEQVSMEEVLADAIDTAQGAGARKQVALHIRACADLPAAYADPMRLRQVMNILLDNSIKFTPSTGSVSVRVVRKDADWMMVEVEDTGCGITAEKQTLVFEKLYQVNGAGTLESLHPGRMGLGLGLHIARDLVTRHGGAIWVESEPGQGCVFRFTVPVYTGQDRQVESSGVTPRRRRSDWMGAAVEMEA